MGKSKQPKHKAPETWEEYVTAEWASYQSHMEGSYPYVPEVNYEFVVGEKVSYGALEDCEVIEVHEGGKLILLRYHDRGESYGRPYDAGVKPRLAWWYDIDPIHTVEETNFGRERIETQFSQTGLDSLVHTCYRRGLIDSPDYQRDYIWTLENKQNLVKSIFNRMDIGKFVLLEYPYPENRLEVIDGKQRLRCIMDFLEGRFKYEGKTWFQLSWRDKQRFQDIMVHIAALQSDKVKKSDILWLFLAINSGGVPQTEEHVAKARQMYEEALLKEKV
jgi:hypothetical protein